MFDPLPGIDAPEGPAGLFSFTLAGGLRPETDAAALHNGMAWSPDERTFYLAHSQAQEIVAFDYDLPAGRLSNRRVFAQVPGHGGIPDGAAVDAQGHYWCAMHGAATLHRYRPDGTLDRQIRLPVSQPTMPAFFGPALDRMAVTSAAQNLTPAQRQAQPHAGALLEFPAPTPGHPRPHTVR
jgi:sugar lactone lactonase YvrE